MSTTTTLTHSPSAQLASSFKQECSSISKEDISFESKIIGGYVLGKTLGSGSCAVVKLGTHCNSGKQVAIKIVKPTSLREQKEVIREVESLQLLKKHPHITRLLRVIREGGYTCLILELGTDGDLFEQVIRVGQMSEIQARSIFRQLVSGIQYCHANLVIHRDLKPENVMIDLSGNAKISDFGLSNILRPGKLCSTFCGSPIYCPPEVVLQQQYNGTLVDVWSLGVILYVMVTGGMPWRLEGNVVKNMEDLIAANYILPDCLGISVECRLLIKMMLTADSKKRATIDMIAHHPWVNIGFDGPPKVHLKPLPLVPKNEINEDIMQQLFALGIDVWQARSDIQAIADSPALTTYHILLEKQVRATKLANVTVQEDTTLSQPKNTVSVHMFRKRSATVPTKQSSSFSPIQNIENYKPQTSLLPKNKSTEEHGILHNIFLYLEKIKKIRKTKDSIPIQHNSPTHSPNLRRRHV